MATCKGRKRDGTPCRSPIVLDNGYCHAHQDQASEAKAPEEPVRWTRERLEAAIAAHGGPEGLPLGGADLSNLDLNKMDLHGTVLSRDLSHWGEESRRWIVVNLQEAILVDANLQEALLEGANLQGAGLQGANLQEADLHGADLQGAYLWRSNLQGANLVRSNLQGANLIGANLQGANLSEDTKLPDGTSWTPDTDMTRFTDPKHPDFWRPGA